jgi:predicted Zn-ribbon and HTH transcriptional regulator
VTIRKEILDRLAGQPRSVSSLARELGLTRGRAEDDLRHALRSAEAAGYRIDIVPARCRICGFIFDTAKLSKPGKCPACHGTRLFEAQVSIGTPLA